MQVEGKRSSSKALLHMLFHILGRYHEHERPDREEYIEVVEKNIIEGTLIVNTNTTILTIYTPYSCIEFAETF